MLIDWNAVVVLETPELYRKIFGENLSFVDLSNTCKAFPHMHYQFKSKNRRIEFPLLDYSFTIIVSDNNFSLQSNYDGPSRIAFLNPESMKKELNYFKELKKGTPLLQDMVTFCIEDKRTFKTLQDNKVFGEIIGEFIDKIFEIFDNSNTLNFKTYNKQYYSSLAIYAIDKMKTSRVKYITNLNFSRVYDFLLNTTFDMKYLFSNISSLKEVGIVAFKNEEMEAVRSLELLLRRSSIKKNLCFNIYGINLNDIYEQLPFVLCHLYKKGLRIKLQYDGEIFQDLSIGYGLERSLFKGCLYNMITEIKINLNEFHKLGWVHKFGVNLKSLAIYIDANSRFQKLSDDPNICYDALLKEIYPLISLMEAKSLIEIAIITKSSLANNRLFQPLIFYFKHIVNYIIGYLPRGIKRLTLSGTDHLDKQLLNNINKLFPNLEALIIRKMLIKNPLNLSHFQSLKVLYLSYVNCITILGNLNIVIIEHGGDFEMETPKNVPLDWSEVPTRWSNDFKRLGDGYDYFFLTTTHDRYLQIFCKNLAKLSFSSYIFKKHKEHIKYLEKPRYSNWI